MSNKKTHWKKMENLDYIGAYSLDEGKDLTVTIKKIVREQVKGMGGKTEECTIAHLIGKKPMILNRTNMKMITKIYDSPFIEDWFGKQITLYVAKINAFGEKGVECLRIRDEVAKLPELTPKHKSWDGAKKAIKDGSYTIEQIKAKYSISATNEKALLK